MTLPWFFFYVLIPRLSVAVAFLRSTTAGGSTVGKIRVSEKIRAGGWGAARETTKMALSISF